MTFPVNARRGERHGRRIVARALLLGASLFTATSVCVADASSAFGAQRHEDTIDTRGPYRVSVEQWSGPKIDRGWVRYTVVNGGRKRRDGQLDARAEQKQRSFFAEIPAQPAGSIVSYYFEFKGQNGQLLRHPAHRSSSYRFRILPLKLLSLELREEDRTQRVSLRLQTSDRPAGDLELRLFSSGKKAQAVRRALSVREQLAKIYLLETELPELKPGEAVDLYFRIHLASREEIRIPADAPAEVFSVKSPLKQLQWLSSDESFVLSVSSMGEQRWIGFKGGGLWTATSPGHSRRLGLGRGLPSGIARFVFPDPASNQVYVGTDRGAFALQQEGLSSLDLGQTVSKSQSAMLKCRAGGCRAGPAALSTLDGTLLFQLQGEVSLEQAYSPTLLLERRDGRTIPWNPPSGPSSILGLSAASFDPIEGCWLLGGLARDGEGGFQPSILRRCGEEVQQIAFPRSMEDASITPSRVIALASEPGTGATLAGLELDKRNGTKDFGVYRVDELSGRLLPLAKETAQMHVEVTSLCADWRRGRVLIGTYGTGLWEARAGIVRPLPLLAGTSRQITSLSVTEDGRSLLVGTSQGALEVSAEDLRASPLGPQRGNLLPADSMPMDVHPVTGRVLASSNTSGLLQLERQTSGQWLSIEGMRPGRELPEGLFGDAQYEATGGIGVLLMSQGLLSTNGKKTSLLTPRDGLYGALQLRLLARRSGGFWLSFAPLPFGREAGGALQLIVQQRALKTIEIEDRDIATIGRWLEVPNRRSIFAATRAGVLEIDEKGALRLLSTNSVSSLARDPVTGSIGAVGTAVERWDGERFVPVLFRIDPPRWAGGFFNAGDPIDIAIDRGGTWYLLYRDGVVVLLDPAKGFLGLLDAEDGIPPTARRLLAHPEYGDVFVGSAAEGLVVLTVRDSK